MKLEFTISGKEQLMKTMQSLGAKGPKIMGKALWKEGMRILPIAKGLVPIDKSALINSGHVTEPLVTPTGAEVTIGFGGSSVKYAAAVHEGSRPHFPPVGPLKEWAVRHGMPESAGYAIAVKISREGTQPIKYLERPLLEAVGGMADRLNADLQKELKP